MAGLGLFAPRRFVVVAVMIAACFFALDGARCETTQKKKKTKFFRAPIRDEERHFQKNVKSWRELQRQNVVMQRRDYSCGAAALATLIQYHWGGNVTEAQLLRETGKMLTIDEMKDRIEKGLSLTDLRRLAVRVGYLASIGRLTYEKLAESKVPLIVGIVVNEYDHFVVYRGEDGQYVYLADPARGNIRIPIKEFVKQWQKHLVLVVVKKGDDGKEKTSPLTLDPEEKLLGETNRQYLRRRMIQPVKPLNEQN